MLILGGAPLSGRQSPLVGWIHASYDRVASRTVTRTGPALALLGVLLLIAWWRCLRRHVSVANVARRERPGRVGVTAGHLPRADGRSERPVGERGEFGAGVRTAAAHVGRAIASDQIVNVNSGEIWVSIEPGADYDGTVAAIEQLVAGHSEVTSRVRTYSDQRIADVLGRVTMRWSSASTGRASRCWKIRREMSANCWLASMDRSPRVDLPTLEPIIEIAVDLQRAQAVGIKPATSAARLPCCCQG